MRDLRKINSTTIKLWNTLSRSIETVVPIKAGHVGIYACGPTVYNYAHVGNLRTYVMVDVLNRVLKANHLKTNLVINITDVGHLTNDADSGQDKLALAAMKENKTALEIASFYEKAFLEDIARLNIQKPDYMPRATEHIQEMIDLISQIEKKGFTYKTQDGVYFDTSKDPEYGQLAKLDVAGLREGARVEVNKEKKNPTDFALWKFSKPADNRQMEWDAPWGRGFPGWHIECSAMSVKYLGLPFDIHTGGIDHIPVHHTNEIAQTKAATGKLLANLFIHFEHLLLSGGKMAKSDSTFITLSDVISKGFDPRAFRYLCLTAHYRERLNFSYENLGGPKNALDRLDNLVLEDGHEDNEALEQAIAIVSNDLATPSMLAFLEKQNNPWLWKQLEPIHGLQLGNGKEVTLSVRQKELLDERIVLKKAGEFSKADHIRHQMLEEGIVVEDTADGYRVKRLSKTG